MPCLLLTGFGAFGPVQENPSAFLARTLHGRRLGAWEVVAATLPVIYRAGLRMGMDLVRESQPDLVIASGVAVERAGITIECRAYNQTAASPDMAGESPADLGNGPAMLDSTLHVRQLAHALQAELSWDPGRYLCNAWLYTVLRDAPHVPACFVHLPAGWCDVERFAAGLRAFLEEEAMHLT